MKILVVDDDENARILLTRILESDGHSIEEATNGEEALMMARKVSYDMIVSDIFMPVMDGFQLCREVRKDNSLKDILFVFCTATYGDREDKNLATKLTADGFIVKPIEVEELKNIIRGIIDNRDKIDRVKLEPHTDTEDEDGEVLKLYKQRLVHKLEKKQLDLKEEIEIRTQTEIALRKSERELGILVRLADLFLTVPDDEIYNEVLQVFLWILEGKYGYFGYIDEEKNLVCPPWSPEVWDESQTVDKVLSFPEKTWQGLGGLPLHEKMVQYINHRLQLPGSHIKVNNSIFMPLAHQDEIIGQIAVINKETDFSDDDIELVRGALSYMAPLLYTRLQREKLDKDRRDTEKKIKEYSATLEKEVKERTRELNRALTDAEMARNRMDGILMSIAGSLIVTDENDNIILMNEAAEKLLNIEFFKAYQEPVVPYFKGTFDWSSILAQIDKGKTCLFDYVLETDDPDHPKIENVHAAGIFDRDDKRIGVVMIINDVTHEREVDRLKNEFISTAAHEFKTPLTSIQGFSELLLTRKDLGPEDSERFLSYINKQAVSLTMIVNDLLDISRIESGKGFELNLAPCKVGDTIQQILPYFEEQTDKHTFEVTLPENPDEILVDKEKMGQVLKNILSNAVKYSPDGGTIRIHSDTSDNYCRVYVEDEGMGMTPEQVDRIFNKFYRADATNSAIEGTGLGMTIVKYIVEAHGGKINVESTLGKGTKVSYQIPKQDIALDNDS